MSITQPLLAFSLLLTLCSAFAQILSTPEKGSEERLRILDAARVKVAADVSYRAPLLFKVHDLRVSEGWALLHAQPVTATGEPIRIDCVEADEITLVLLRFREGAWRVERGGTICANDVFWLAWHQELGTPAQLFDLGVD